ncbi:phosphonate transport system ATP-binding protein [Janthinobacterium sp. OK676]|uniref:phosphonate ABC transporter ATP-binding protein n=1 Tax=unclassified Janthinobacterium TaxID=2610881 RepID=UPI00088EC2FD|nr:MULTISPECIES: ATP-binding cassette domain-containing protein [unclassified Janthinobacterium]PJJ17873.1 phosphonate transport system ATP-binding protein [Janthinobacterium sp. 67]SDL43232.1 phosphonate transport system ATP-binding protein [Janthinobacterium sp. OK676]
MTFQLHKVSVHHAGAAGNALALRELSLDVAQGEQIALIGPSGAGKTSLLHTLACALRPESGTLNILGTSPWQLGSAARHALRARLFLAPQTPPLPPRQRVVNTVLAGRLPQWSLWTAIRSLLAPVDPRAAWEALGKFNLQDKLYARVDRLSGGERQRCGMARALVSDAEVFLVDEPLSALDPTLALQTINVLQTEATARNATLICSLHQVEIARACFTRIVALRDGQVVFDARSSEVSDAMIAELYRNKADPAPQFEAVEANLDAARPLC